MLCLKSSGRFEWFHSSNVMQSASTFSDDSLHPAVRGFLHSPEKPNGEALILTHSAGSDCNFPLLVSLAETFAGQGYLVLRCDLPFRQERRTGPPFPGNAERDRAGLHNAVTALHKIVTGHPPRKTEQLRVQHFPNLHTPSLFVHGTRDPFGSVEEMTEALRVISAKTDLIAVEGAGHDLGFKGKAQAEELPTRLVAKFKAMFG
jgi:predicted alpha/beta-hydrolase family hydrolase